MIICIIKIIGKYSVKLVIIALPEELTLPMHVTAVEVFLSVRYYVALLLSLCGINAHFHNYDIDKSSTVLGEN